MVRSKWNKSPEDGVRSDRLPLFADLTRVENLPYGKLSENQLENTIREPVNGLKNDFPFPTENYQFFTKIFPKWKFFIRIFWKRETFACIESSRLRSCCCCATGSLLLVRRWWLTCGGDIVVVVDDDVWGIGGGGGEGYSSCCWGRRTGDADGDRISDDVANISYFFPKKWIKNSGSSFLPANNVALNIFLSIYVCILKKKCLMFYVWCG